MNSVLLTVIVLTSSLVNGQQGQCSTPSGAQGQCIVLNSCQPLMAIINKPQRTSEEVTLLKQSQCGFVGKTPAVCCPETSERTQAGECYTPEGKPGQCLGIYQCPGIANMLRPPIPTEKVQFLQQSRCNGPEQYSVCCGPIPDFDNVQKRKCDTRVTAFPPDPRTECCGFDSSTGNKIVGGDPTSVDQYPWLVIIEYVDRNGATKTLCGGALISGKYVLTAGHCVSGKVLTMGTPSKIRLGDYDTTHEGPDCIPAEPSGEDCTKGAVRIAIEKTIPHPQYNSANADKRNDIALIRMAELAPYTEFIRPICLPTKDRTQGTNVFNATVAGWGAVSTKQSSSNVKLHVELPFVTQTACQPAYSVPGRSVQLWQGQFCAGGQKGKDSCKGDSGGPLMYENGRSYEAIGVVSFGPIPCGLENIPGVYTNVFEYTTWIRSNITP